MTGSAVHMKPEASITSRSTEMLQYLADGLSQKQISIVLGIAYSSVKKRFCQISAELDAESTVHAVVIAMRKGLIR